MKTIELKVFEKLIDPDQLDHPLKLEVGSLLVENYQIDNQYPEVGCVVSAYEVIKLTSGTSYEMKPVVRKII